MTTSISLLLAAGLLISASFVTKVSASSDDFYECLPGMPKAGGKYLIMYYTIKSGLKTWTEYLYIYCLARLKISYCSDTNTNLFMVLVVRIHFFKKIFRAKMSFVY